MAIEPPNRKLDIIIGLMAAVLCLLIVHRLMHGFGVCTSCPGSTVENAWTFVRESGDALAALGILVISLVGDIRSKLADLLFGKLEEVEPLSTDAIPAEPETEPEVEAVRPPNRRRRSSK